MGFLKRLLSKDPETLLDRAAGALERGAGVEALSRLEKLPEGLSAEAADRRRKLEAQAHDAVCRAAVEKARELEEADMLEEAADRLGAALEHCQDEAERRRLGAKRQDLLELLARRDAPPEEDDEPAQDLVDLDPDESYGMLVAMLREDVAQRYADRPEAFRRAYVDLHEGRADVALEAFDRLTAEHPDDGVLRFERGHCLLVLGRPADARPELEAAWPELGDDHLDDAGSLSVPLLWADALLELGEHEALVDRLAGLAHPSSGEAALAHRLGLGLVALDRLDEAVEHLDACCTAFPAQADFPHSLATVLHRRGERRRAVEVLERAVAPSCAGGGCGRPSPHLPSLRALAALHLDEGNALPRVGELMELIAGGQRGRLQCEDHYLLARLRRAEGDEHAFAREIERARSLLPEGDAAMRAVLDELEAGGLA